MRRPFGVTQVKRAPPAPRGLPGRAVDERDDGVVVLLARQALDAGLLPGITREFLFDVGKEIGVDVREQVLRDEDLFGADEAFLTSTTREAVPIVTVNDRTMPSRTSDKWLSPVFEISSSPSAPCTTNARSVPSSASTRASGSVSAAAATPITWAFALAGFVSGPSKLNTVRMPISLRAAITFFIAVWSSGA